MQIILFVSKYVNISEETPASTQIIGETVSPLLTLNNIRMRTMERKIVEKTWNNFI